MGVSLTIHPDAEQILGAEPSSLTEFVRSCLDEHNRLLCAGDPAVRKNSPESSVTLVDLPGFPRVCVKEFRRRSLLHALKSLFRSTQGLRAYKNGWRLAAKGFQVPLPLVLVRKRRMGLIESEWIIMEAPANALEMDRYLVKRIGENWSIGERRTTVTQFGRYIGSLHAEGIFHADLKTCNIMVSTDRPYGKNTGDRVFTAAPSHGIHPVRFALLDYDEVRFFHQMPIKKRLKNLMQIFLSTPQAVGGTDRFRFLGEYGLHVGIDRKRRRALAQKVIRTVFGKDILYVGFNGDVREPWKHKKSSLHCFEEPSSNAEIGHDLKGP